MKNRLFTIVGMIALFCVSGASPFAAGQNETLPEETGSGAEGQANPFIFMWGRSYERILSEIPADRITAQKPGEWIQFKQSGLVCRYSFYLRRKIKAIHPVAPAGAGEARKTGRSRRYLSPPMPVVEYEPLERPEEARLFAVSIHYGPMAMDVQYRNAVEKVLIDTYGKIMNRRNAHFDMENNVTFVRAYLENYRKRDYLSRLVFSSKELSREMNAGRLALEKEATERLKTAMASAPGAAASPDPDLPIESDSIGYMSSAEEEPRESASMLEESLPPVAEEIQPEPAAGEGEPDPADTTADGTEPEKLEAPPSPSGLNSEALPPDFVGGDDIQNPFELP